MVHDGRWICAPQTQGAEAKAILAVPLLSEVQEDKLIWNEEKDGLYSVRSGYRKIMEERSYRGGPRTPQQCGKIWKVQAPPKAKHLMWRIYKECLLTRMRLRNHYVQCQPECPLCLQVPEEDWHLLLECEGSKEAWNVMGLEAIITPRLHLFHDIKALILDVCYNENKEVAAKMAMLLWTIWHNRNNIVWNETKVSARLMGMQAANMWNEWAKVNELVAVPNSTTALQSASHTHDQWQPPRQGYVKCNVDVSFLNTFDKTGWGWCIRDHQGRFVLAGCNIINGRLNTIEGEAMTIKEAIHELIQRGFSHAIIESDSQIAIGAISSLQHGSLEFSSIISNIKSLLLLVFNFEVKFVERQANMVTHSLARVTYSKTSRCIFESISLCIEHFLINDMN